VQNRPNITASRLSQAWRHEGEDSTKKYKRWEEEEVPPFLESYGKHVLIYRGKELWCAIQRDLQQMGIHKSPWSLEKKWNNILRRFRQNNSEGSFSHYPKVKSILESKMAWHHWVPIVTYPSSKLVNTGVPSPPEETDPFNKTSSRRSLVDILHSIEKSIQDMRRSHQRESQEREQLLCSVLKSFQSMRPSSTGSIS
jgi:hypothetical protein